ITPVTGRLLQTEGTLSLYEFTLPAPYKIAMETPLSIVPSDDMEPTEGLTLASRENVILVQTFDALGPSVERATIIPDHAGLLTTWGIRLQEMLTQTDAYRLGPADRLAPMFDLPLGSHETTGSGAAIVSTIWSEDPSMRRQRIASLAIELIRANKRILLVCPDHQAADDIAGSLARAMKAGGLMYRTWMSRYEMTLAREAAGMPIHELGFEAQMHQFYAKSRAEKAALRRKYERFRELTPLLAYKSQKQKDLDEVRLLEWRLLTQVQELQAKIKEANDTLQGYENLPLLRRLSMQAVGKNVESLRQYLELYESQIAALMKELEIAKARIAELAPEAAVPKDMRPEFDELKEDIVRLGGTKKIRELLAAEEQTNRQAFIQNRRLVITTATRVLGDPLFSRIRFDVLIAENAPRIAPLSLFGAACLVHERIVLTGDVRETATVGLWGATTETMSTESV
ncbi:MAG TPA: hypothetical protein VIU63_01775, partial [Nitrospira sp.]